MILLQLMQYIYKYISPNLFNNISTILLYISLLIDMIENFRFQISFFSIKRKHIYTI